MYLDPSSPNRCWTYDKSQLGNSFHAWFVFLGLFECCHGSGGTGNFRKQIQGNSKSKFMLSLLGVKVACYVPPKVCGNLSLPKKHAFIFFVILILKVKLGTFKSVCWKTEPKSIGSGQSQQSQLSSVNQSQLKVDMQPAPSAGKRKTRAKRGKTGNRC